MAIPYTENALILRADFSDQAAWEKIRKMILAPVSIFRFRANVDFLDDRTYEGITMEQLLAQIPRRYNHSFICLVDGVTVSMPDHPILVVDLIDSPGQNFRAIPKTIQAIENNLSIGNMDFDEFARAVDDQGVFRGFPGDPFS